MMQDRLRARLRAIIYQTRMWVWFSALVLSIRLVLLVGIAQYWLPTLLSDKAEVERYLSSLSKQTITVGKIRSAWDGIYPGVHATDIRIGDTRSESGGIYLKEARLSLSYLSVLRGQAILHRFILVEPNLELVRSRDGKVSITGIRNANRKRDVGSDGMEKGSIAANWLLAQGQIEIQKGKLVWNDLSQQRHQPMEFGNVYMVLRNDGDRHRLDFDASFPEDICKVCSFRADIEGNPFESKDWGGFVDLNAIGLSLRNRLTRMASVFPDDLDGKVDMVVRSQWAQGRPRLAFGRVTANEIDVPLGRFGESLTVNEMVASVKWRGRKNTWSLDMKLPFARVNNETWLPGKVTVTRYIGGTSLFIRHLDIGKAVRLSNRFRIPEEPARLLARLEPTGSVDELYIDLKDKADNGTPTGNADRISVKAGLRDLQTSPYRKIPGVKGLSASFETTESGGQVFLNSYQSEFNSTHIFREPIRMHRARARVTWQKKNDVIEVNTQNIQLQGHDVSARGGFVFQFPLDRSRSPHLDLRAELYNGQVARKSTYFPVNVMKPSLVQWLDESVISGKLTRGHVIYRGKTREFPFVNNNGLFEVQVNVDHGKLKYLPGWRPITNANMSLLFRGQSMVITSSAGKVDQLDINEVVARKDNLKNKQEPVKISGRLTGSVGSTLSVLRNAVANGQTGGWTRFVQSDVRASGPGQLTLGIEIPAIQGRKHRLRGRFEFLGSDMVLPIGDIPANNMHGVIRFNEQRLLDGTIRARTLGGPVEVLVAGGAGRRDPDVSFRLSGRMTTAGLAGEYGEWINRYFSGAMPWTGELEFRDGIANVSLSGDAQGITNSLPAPVKELSASAGKFELSTSSSTEKRHLLRFSLGDRMNGLLDYHARSKGWRFMEGRMVVGEGQARLRGDKQFFLEFNGDRLDVGAWADVFQGKGSGGDMPMLVQGVEGDFSEVDFLGREWGKTGFRMRRTSLKEWSGTLTGDAIAGSAVLDTAPAGGKISLDLQRLHIPQAREDDKRQASDGNEPDPRNFPALTIDSVDFSVGPMKLGKLNFSADRTRIGWEIDRLQLTSPDMSLFADGTWFLVAGNYVARTKLRLTSSDLGATMAALGNPDQVTGGKLNLDMNLSWRQDRKASGIGNLNGDISLLASDGKLNKVSADGAGGPFSLFALGRYLSLDFSPALGKGFAFKEIKGKINIQRGDAQTDGLTLVAPAAAAVARGHIDMNKKELDIHADIYPNLRGGVTVATGTLFGLQAAAWAYALQQLFSSEIEKETRISYHISGDLDKPVVTKVVSKK